MGLWLHTSGFAVLCLAGACCLMDVRDTGGIVASFFPPFPPPTASAVQQFHCVPDTELMQMLGSPSPVTLLSMKLLKGFSLASSGSSSCFECLNKICRLYC